MTPLVDGPPERLCILRLSAIGDTCNVLPVVRTLQRVWPETRLTWIIGRTEAALLADVDGVEFITVDKRAGRAAHRALAAQLTGRRFPVLLHMHASMRANRLSRSIDARLRLGFDRARARDFQWLFTNARIAPAPRPHVVDGFFAFLEALGIRERVLSWDVPVPDDARDFADAVVPAGRPVLAISPCSSQRARNYRNWPVERYFAAAQHARERYGAAVVLTGGRSPLERDYGARIATALGGDAVNLVGETTLKQLYAVLSRASVLVCPDSGPAHMATAAGTPVIGLFATSNPDRTGPYVGRELSVNRYPDAVRRAFGRSVEEIRWGRRVRDPDAMELIRVEDVTERLDRVLGTPG
jgi:heptosyltransferase I